MSLTALPSVKRLSSRVWRILGLNPGKFTLQGTNTYLIGTGHDRLLIDTGEADREDYSTLLLDTLQSLTARVTQIVITHWHHDHLGGLPNVLKTVCKGHETCVYKLPLKRNYQTELNYPLRGEVDNVGITEEGIVFLNDGDILKTEGCTLRVVATPGHTQDHLSLWLEEENAVFSGDCILGEGSAVFEDLGMYMASLNKLLKLHPQKLYPGHGPVVEEGESKIQEYITHREAREQQIVDHLELCSMPISSFQIVEHIYKDVDQMLWLGAENNVKKHLDKLWKEGKVERTNDKEILWKLINKL